MVGDDDHDISIAYQVIPTYETKIDQWVILPSFIRGYVEGPKFWGIFFHSLRYAVHSMNNRMILS